jgi:glycine dehydrogenase subunit 2
VQPPQGKRALDIAKGLIDYGYHPPTIYFPLVVKEAMLIEPTETESKETLDDFIGTMLELAETDQEDLEEAPTHAPTRRLDETRAARQLKARW